MKPLALGFDGCSHLVGRYMITLTMAWAFADTVVDMQRERGSFDPKVPPNVQGGGLWWRTLGRRDTFVRPSTLVGSEARTAWTTSGVNVMSRLIFYRD